MPAFSTGNTGASTGFNPLDAGTDLLGGLLTGVGGFLGGPAGSLLGTGLGIDALNEMRGLGKEAQAEALRIGQQAQQDTAFKPFSISTGFGGVQAGPQGGYTTTLSPQGQAQQQALQGITSGLIGGMQPSQGPYMPGTPSGGDFSPMMSSMDIGLNGLPSINGRDKYVNNLTGEVVSSPTAPPPSFGTGAPNLSGIQNQAFGGIQGLLQQAQGSTAGREQDIYDRIRATQMPEEQRQQLALNEQLAAQGRTGLRTAQFGGSPEQLAMEKARSEAMNQASLMSINQAEQQRASDLAAATGMFGLGSQASFLPSGLQQAQLGNIGASMGLQYMPENQLLASLTPALSLADLSSVAQRQGAGLLAEAGMSGLSERLGSEKTRTEGLAGLYNSLINAQGQTAASATGAAGGTSSNLLGSLFSFLGDR
jgi:hypothetical protein